MRSRRNKADENPWQDIYTKWTEAPRERRRAALASVFPHLVQMGADAATFDWMIDQLTPVLQMRAITGMGPDDWLGGVFDGQHR